MFSRDLVDGTLNDSLSRAAMVYRAVTVFLVVTICVTFVVETYPLSPETLGWLYLVDNAITVLFFIDYLVRWWAKRFSIRYLFTPFALIDLVSILPLFLVNTHFQFVRVVRLFRILRLLRFLRSREGKRLSEFHIRLGRIFFTLFCIIFISSGMIYDVEGYRFTSFFEALYFSVVTMTTVGYGDIVPITTAGRFVTLLMICSGMVLIPWQLTELFRHVVQQQTTRDLKCKACGLDTHDRDARFCKMCGNQLKE